LEKILHHLMILWMYKFIEIEAIKFNNFAQFFLAHPNIEPTRVHSAIEFFDQKLIFL